jgi:inner membrane protein
MRLQRTSNSSFQFAWVVVWRHAWVVGLGPVSAIAGRRPWFITTLVVASVLPDLDLFWFYFVDNRQHLHHTYWTHIPSFWLLVSFLLTLFALPRRRRAILPYVGALTVGVLLHLLLDTVAGGIY